MEKFYFEEPTIERKKDALDYLQEHVNTKSAINGTGGLNRCLNGMTYEEWLTNIINRKNINYLENQDLVPETTFFTIRESDNKIIGMVNFRHGLNDKLYRIGGHIGYGIRPSERGKGYSKIQLYLALIEAQKIGLDRVMVNCLNTNEVSERTIKALGGISDGQEYDKEKDRIINVYWINVTESIEKNFDKYSKYLLSKNNTNYK